jgi:hypothetical protein
VFACYTSTIRGAFKCNLSRRNSDPAGKSKPGILLLFYVNTDDVHWMLQTVQKKTNDGNDGNEDCSGVQLMTGVDAMLGKNPYNGISKKASIPCDVKDESVSCLCLRAIRNMPSVPEISPTLQDGFHEFCRDAM